MICPNCSGNVPSDTTICPDCQENLAALVQLEQRAAIYHNQALELARQGELERARAMLLAAAESAPDSAPVQRLLAKVCARLGRWDEALQAAACLRQLAPDDEAALCDQVEAEARSADTSSALARDQHAAARSRMRQRFAALYEHDVTAAFGLGVVLTALVALFLSRLRGRRRG
ncbi:MAG: hypothetical protein V1772_13550 [Chloroflexota bacterium]